MNCTSVGTLQVHVCSMSVRNSHVHEFAVCHCSIELHSVDST